LVGATGSGAAEGGSWSSGWTG